MCGSIIIPMSKLYTALDTLDQLLGKHKLRVNLLICGAFALEMHGLTSDRGTFDVDSAIPLSADIFDLIDEVAESVGLERSSGERWLNDKASTVSLPPKLKKRALPISRWQNIDAKLIDRRDFISMKVSAFFIRRGETTKDLEDLQLLDPSNNEIDEALLFVSDFNSPPLGSPGKILEEYQESIDDIKRLFTK